MEVHQNTPIAVTGCAKAKALAQPLAVGLKACHNKHGKQRGICERAARAKFARKASRAPKGKR